MEGRFTEDRALHSRGVAILMRRLTPVINRAMKDAHDGKNRSYDGLDPNEMALLGWLHDFGYLLDEDPDAHAKVMGDLMDREDLPYSMVVGRHGDPKALYTPVDLLLNACDMSVDGHGRLVSLDMRIRDVADRWGEDHRRTVDVRRMKEAIESDPLWSALDAAIHGLPEFEDHRPLG